LGFKKFIHESQAASAKDLSMQQTVVEVTPEPEEHEEENEEEEVRSCAACPAIHVQQLRFSN
jgi:hypothetical protein